MFNLTSLFGLELLIRLAAYVGVVVLGLSLHMFVTYGLAVWWAGAFTAAFSAKLKKQP